MNDPTSLEMWKALTTLAHMGRLSVGSVVHQVPGGAYYRVTVERATLEQAEALTPAEASAETKKRPGKRKRGRWSAAAVGQVLRQLRGGEG